MRKLVIALASVLCFVSLGGSVAGETQQTPPVFRGGVALVTVDVIVLDRDGKPVAGLTADDFDVKLNGQSRPVRTLDYLKVAAVADAQPKPAAAAPPPSTGPTGRHTVSNVAPAGEPRAFVLLIDDLSFSPTRGKSMFTAASRFVARLPASDVVGFTTSSQSSAVNPTLDHAAVRAALDQAVGQFSDPRTSNEGSASTSTGDMTTQHNVGLTESLEIESGLDATLKDVIARECFRGMMTEINAQGLPMILRENQCASDVQRQARRTAALIKQTTGRQMQAYLGVISAMRPAPGIKHLVVLSDGLALHQDVTSIPPVARAAAEAGVQVSVLTATADADMGDRGPIEPARQTAASSGAALDAGPAARRRADDQMLASGVQTVTDMTGGIFYRVVGTPDPFFERIATASSAVYRLGVETPPETTPGRTFTVAATTRRAGLTVRANRHAVAPAPPVASPIDDQLKAAISTGGTLYGVPISMAPALRRASGGTTLELGITVRVPSTVKGPLTTMFGIVDASTNLRSGRRAVEIPAEGRDFMVSFGLPVPPGRYRLRFAVADAEGHVGSVEYDGMAELTSMGPFLVSDIFTVWSDATAKPQFIALEDLPATATTLDATLELYPGGAAPEGVLVKMALVGQVEAAPSRDLTPEVTNGMLRASTQFQVGSIPVGIYALRAVVSVAGKDIGTVTTTIRKR